MNSTVKKIILAVLILALLAEVAFVGYLHLGAGSPSLENPGTEPSAATPTATAEPETQAPTQVPTEAPTEAPTEEPTEPPTEAPTEPTSFTLTFAGDCTFGSTAAKWNTGSSFVQTVGENYDWPFANLVDYFANDDFTMINLEGPLTESGSAAQKTFAFRGPTAYTQIMTGSSVEAVTLANNHSMDYGKEGYQNTLTALESAGIGYVEEDKTSIYVTETGLTIGLYADSFNFSASAISKNVSELKQAGVDIIICAFHWGTEGSYRPNATMEKMAKAAIDAGADIVYGHHPHVLQKIEEYGDGIIFYSLGNCSFGGSTAPKDFDSAIVQQQILRNEDGSCSLGELTIIPISVSSIKGQNNYQPTPLEEGSDAYNRVLTKLDGTFTGPDLVVDYSNLEPSTTPSQPAQATQPPQPAEPAAPVEPAPDSGSAGSGGDSGEAAG